MDQHNILRKDVVFLNFKSIKKLVGFDTLFFSNTLIYRETPSRPQEARIGTQAKGTS